MSKGPHKEAVTVEADGVHVEKSFSAEEFPVPAVTFRITSEHDEAIQIRIKDQVPESFPMDRVGFHPEYDSDNWTAYKDHRVEFERELSAGETLTTVYGIRAEDLSNVTQFLSEPDLKTVPAGESVGASQDDVEDVLGPDDTEAVRQVLAGERDSLPGAESDPQPEASQEAVAAAAESKESEDEPETLDLETGDENVSPRDLDDETTAAVTAHEPDSPTRSSPDQMDAPTDDADDPGTIELENPNEKTETGAEVGGDERDSEANADDVADEPTAVDDAGDETIDVGDDETDVGDDETDVGDDESDVGDVEIDVTDEAAVADESGVAQEDVAQEDVAQEDVAQEDVAQETDDADESAIVTDDTDGSTATHASTTTPEGGIAAALADEIRSEEVDDDDLELLREELDFGVPNSVDVRLNRLQSTVENLAAYSDALEEFIDENGTAQAVLEELESDVTSLNEEMADLDSRVDAADDDRVGIDERIDGIVDDIATVETNVGAVEDDVSAVDDRVTDVDDRVTNVDDRVSSVSRTLEDVGDRIDELESRAEELSGITDDVESLDSEIGDVREEITEFDAQMTDLEDDFESELAGVGGSIQSIEADIENLKEFRDNLSDAFGP